MTTNDSTPNFTALLETALSEPGRISDAYNAFHGYSLGNQLLALGQCMAREIPVGPIASFNKWKELGRRVTKGSKAIELCMPITCKGKGTDTDAHGEQTDGETRTYTRFVFRRNWFVLAQTEGAEYQAPTLPDWDRTRALEALSITEGAFELLEGNVQGYAKDRTIAINPVAALPFKTTFHELAHIVLGHTAEGTLSDDERTPRSLREVEAEGVAMLCCAALGLPGLEESRGYMQSWYAEGQTIPEASARKILKGADQILKAGRPAETKGGN